MITSIPFGQTGHQSSRIIFGAFAVAYEDQKRADEILELLLEYGINHIDTAPTYGDSELRIGPWMRRYREQFFLATKTGERTYEKAYAEIQQSLERLQTDQIDLIQFHNLVDPEEWETAFAPGGALEAAIEAKEKGYVRFIGVTGHGITVAARHLLSLKRFPFDSVLLPYNYEFMHKTNSYPADFEALYMHCQENGVAMQTIKSVARGRWATRERFAKVWYEPLKQQKEIDAAVSFVLNRPNIFLNSSGDPDLLPRTLSAAQRYCAGESFEAPEPILAEMELRPLFTTSDTI
ncbi:MAG: aldo/keto reductase [Chloroflexota bacterium]